MAKPQPKSHFEDEAAAFIKEVDETMHLDRLKALWDAYKMYVFAAVAALFVAVAGTEYYTNWHEKKLADAGDAYQALLANDAQVDEEALQAIQNGSSEGFKILSAFTLAKRSFDAGDVAGAVAAYDEIASTNSYPEHVRQLATFMQGLALMGSQPKEAYSHFSQLENDDSPYRPLAFEMMGYLAENDGDAARAYALYEKAMADETAPQSLRERVSQRLEVIQAEGALSQAAPVEKEEEGK